MKASATITMSRPVLDRLRKVAAADKRTISQQLELLVERHFAAHPARRRQPRKAAAV